MSYRVLYTDQFHSALESQIQYFETQWAPPARVARWLMELIDLMDTLDVSPERYPVATLESGIAGIALRKIVFGDYLAFYHVDHAKREVQVLGFGMAHGCHKLGAPAFDIRAPWSALRRYRAQCGGRDGARQGRRDRGRHTLFISAAVTPESLRGQQHVYFDIRRHRARPVQCGGICR